MVARRKRAKENGLFVERIGKGVGAADRYGDIVTGCTVEGLSVSEVEPEGARENEEGLVVLFFFFLQVPQRGEC